MTKKKILVMIDWYLPGYKAGGPVQSVANIISQLHDDFDFMVITTDTDLHDSNPYAEIKSGEWNTLSDGTQVYYIPKSKCSYFEIKKLILQTPHDVMYLNSFFSKYFTIVPLLISKFNEINSKIIIAPRGMLGAGSLRLKSAKKKFFIRLSKIFGLYKNVTWHASTDLEKEEIKKLFGSHADIKIAINLSSQRTISNIKREKQSGELRLAFLSRIAEKKNLHAVAGYLSKVKTDSKVQFDIYGVIDEKNYWERCEKLFSQLPANCKVVYKGVVSHDQITNVLSNYHFSILPSLNENFGHAIVESFISGCPVIISDCTPWRNLESIKAGWDISLLNEDKFVSALNSCIHMNQTEYDEWSNGAYCLAEKIVSNKDGVDQNRKLFSGDQSI